MESDAEFVGDSKCSIATSTAFSRVQAGTQDGRRAGQDDSVIIGALEQFERKVVLSRTICSK